MNNRQKLTVPDGDTGLRLDVWLTRQLTGFSRSRIQALIRSGNVKVDGRIVKEHHKTRAAECVGIVIPPLKVTKLRAEAIPLDILHQDADIIVINKPAGLVTHPAAGHPCGTLVNALLHYCPDLSGIGWELRPGIVHRLDKDTSGVLVAAKNENAMTSLMNQFKNRQVQKEYLALIWGQLTPAAGTVQTRIGRHPRDRKKMSANTKAGRLSVTNYQTLRVLNDISLVLVRPGTGRTHQIRVHFAHLGHPVVGDSRYGKRSSKTLPVPVRRQMLHARKLSFIHPYTQQHVEFCAPLPSDMADLIESLSATDGSRCKVGTSFKCPPFP